jgi:GIY-YIG catalytic domain.
MRTYSVYEITNPKGNIYIGISINIKSRLNEYKRMNCVNQPYIYNSLKKYGVANHVFRILASELTTKEAVCIEMGLIKFNKDNHCSLNVAAGGLTPLCGKESLNHVSVIQLNINGDLIKKWDCIMEASISFGCATTAIGNACKIGYRTNFAVGYLWQYESDYLNGVALKINSKYNKVVQFNINGDFVKKWENSTDAAKSIGVTSSSVTSASHFKYNSNLSGGFLWLTDDDYNAGIIPTYPHRDEPIIQISLIGEYIKTWDNLNAASFGTGINKRTIKSAIYGHDYTAHGYLWQKESLYLQGIQKQELWANTPAYQKFLKNNC